MNETSPKISVIMPVYNAGKFLRQAIDSVLQQSFANFELIIINDGSTDDSEKTILNYSDKRIRHFNQANQGLIATLNHLISEAKGLYIARMDQDDVSFPERLKIQSEFLAAHPSIGLVGSWVQVVDRNNDLLGTIKYPVAHDFIRANLALRTCFAHGSIMMRHSLNPVYNRDFLHAEDYELWCRLALQTQMANIPRILYQWRFHPASTSSVSSQNQKSTAKKIQSAYAIRLLAQTSDNLTANYKNEKTLRGIYPLVKLLANLLKKFPFSNFSKRLLKIFLLP